MHEFKKISVYDMKENVFKLIGKDWMLVTAGTINSFNTMTASWGGLGELWNKQVAFIFVRPNRYTYEFLEKNERFTLSFFEEKYREALNYCGSHSGKTVDKMTDTGLNPVLTDKGSVFFTEARLVLECKKLYFQDLDPKHFLENDIAAHYPRHDYHRMYIGEIIDVHSR